MPNQKKAGFIFFLVLATGVLFLFSLNVVRANAKQTITVAKVEKPAVTFNDRAWQIAKSVPVNLKGKGKFAGKRATVTVMAAYTDQEIYFRFRWQDRTRSVTKGAWKYDGEEWSHQEGDEDGIALLFEINRIKDFATQGCAVVCHVPDGAGNAKGGKFGTSSADEKGDLWHWKSALSDPTGYSEDSWLTVISETRGGRKNDGGQGGDKTNVTEDKAKPKYMLTPGKKLVKRNILLAFDAEEINDYSIFEREDTITYRMPRMPFGSRADIKAVSRHRRRTGRRGGWTLILYRKLDTGRGDDVVFDPLKNYNFAMALFNDSGNVNSYDSEVLALEFEQ